MKVAIINTRFKGTEVHAPGCADVPKSEKRNNDEAWVVDVESKVDLSHTYWYDQISDTCDPESAEGWETAVAWMGEFNILPCVKGLAHDHREVEVTEDEATPAPATAVSTWVGKAIANVVMYRSGSLGEKVTEAKPTKAGDRTVKLTAEEAAELRAVCTELEAQGGSLAYSARTLRARLS